jgi:glutaconyl-CoA/methylmalonyl-CoA decarboxylase subunit gamma
MKYKFRINNKPYEVDLLDIHSQPITAIVNGEIIDVWLEEETPDSKIIEPLSAPQKLSTVVLPKNDIPIQPQNSVSPKKAVQSPIPGVIISVNVHIGDQVHHGQELCVIEAMKMKNMIRSPRDGSIKLVNIRIGQAVQYHDILFEYSE